MRLWSLHPNLLDNKGLVAVWREALLALAVLKNQTKGYRFHPQLDRFKKSNDPIAAIAIYLNGILQEAEKRNYNFDKTKIPELNKRMLLSVTAGQLVYELNLLKSKVAVRCPQKLSEIQAIDFPRAHPLFQVISGQVEEWEKPRTDLL